MSKTRQRWLVAAAFTVPLALLVGCAGGAPAGGESGGGGDSPFGGALGTPAEETAMQELYTRALDAGEYEVTAYGPPPAESVTKSFMARFPDIEITFEQLQSQDRITRLQAEAASGNHVGDVALDGRTPIISMALNKPSWCQPFQPAIDVPASLIALDGLTVKTYNTVFGVIINTDLISEKEAPTSWEALIDPKWKGKEVMVSPAAGGAGALVNAMLLTPQANADKWGMKIVEGLKNNVSLVAKDAQTISSVVDGTYPIGVLAYYPYYFQTLQNTPNAPVKFMLLDEGTGYSVGEQCVLANAPHPNAAQLWANWVMSKEGQAALAKSGAYPSMPGSPAPPGLPAPGEASLITLLPDEQAVAGYTPFVKQIQALYGG